MKFIWGGGGTAPKIKKIIVDKLRNAKIAVQNFALFASLSQLETGFRQKTLFSESEKMKFT